MTALRSWLALLLGLGIGGAVLAGGLYILDRRAETAAAAVSFEQRDYAGPRIWYSPDSYPQLALPGGSRQTVRSVLNVKHKLQYGEYVWDEEFIGKGKVWVRVDLDRQLLSVFRGGHEIGTAVILYGADSMPTPAGTFPVLQKAADYHSMTYDAPMPYMLRLTADGVAIHGSDVRRGAATHGCIGVPTAFARLLFAQVKLGDPVVILTTAA